MSVKLGDIIGQIGSGTYKLVNAKDIDIVIATDGTEEGALSGTELLICDTDAAGVVKKITVSQIDHDILTNGEPHQPLTAVLTDISDLGVVVSDGQFMVGTGEGVFAYESGSTVRDSLGLGISDTPELTQIVLGIGPSLDAHAATKSYVDSLGGGGSSFWTSVAIATTEAISLAIDLEDGDILDGWVLVEGDRVLVKDQVDAAENGLYVVSASGAASRADDANIASEILSRKCIILHGTVNVGLMYFCTNSEIILGVTDIEFKPLSGSGNYGFVELMGEEIEAAGVWELPLTADDVDTEWEVAFSLPSGQAVGTVPGGVYGGPIEFGWGGVEKAISKLKFTGEMANLGDSYVKLYYYEGGWVYVGEQHLTVTTTTYEFDIGEVVHPTKWKLEHKTNGVTANNSTYIYDIRHWVSTVTEQHKITLIAGAPTVDYTITFPDTNGDANQVMLSDGSGVLSWGGHDDLVDYVSGEHYVQTDITAVSSILSTGLLKVTTGTGELSVIADNSSDWDEAYGWGDHSGLYMDVAADYSAITANDGGTDVSAAELEELTDGSETALHSHAGGGHTDYEDLSST